ncbi:radical SAM family heme chaperone HemW [Kiritimatiellaeota bacterium B1221]|nr:radical SAM family heme chaperone HemW [Kiritimatiellaeota bacterium B1221]
MTFPSSLYLHVPFCVRRCLYCDFYVLPLGDGPPAKRLREFRSLKHHRYLQALDAELAALPENFQPSTLYIGGGTPTEMGVGELQKLFSSLKRHVDFSQVKEFCCEANPGTLDKEMAALLVEQGVTRVSLGVQSFADPMLQALGRIHNQQDAFDAVGFLREAGVKNLSVDLLFALPDPGPRDLEVNLEAIRKLNPEHVSWYSLEFEQGTAFTEMRDQGFLQEPDEESTAAEYAEIRKGLSERGFNQYELFSFSKSGFECRHNINYWRGGEYYGVGPSAHSHVDGKRWSNLSDLSAYIKRHCQGEGSCISEAEELSSTAKARELLMTQLRLLAGVNTDDFHQLSGHRIEDLLGPSLQVWQDAGWVQLKNQTLKLLPEAYLISDSLFREFV